MLTSPISLALLAFLLNLPLGKWRTHQPKRSPLWFAAIHLSIPLVIFLRFSWHLPTWVIPVEVVAIGLGQWLGGRLPWPQWANRHIRPRGEGE